MALATKEKRIARTASRHERHTDQSAANTALTVTPTVGVVRKLLFVAVKYSAAPTQTGVTVTLNSGAGAAWDSVLNTGTANAQTTTYLPDGEVVIGDDDVLDVLAPAGGVGITSQISVYSEVLS